MADLLKRLKISEQQYGVGMEDNPFQDVSNDEAMKVCFGGGGGGQPPPPPPTTMTQQTSNIPEYFQPYLERLFDRAESVTTEPFQRYEGQRLAEFTPEQQAAYSGVEGLVGDYKPYLASADLLTAQAAQQSTDPTAIAARMNPYQQAVIDIQKREALRDAEKLQQQIGAQAVGAGAYGGSRQALIESELARQQGQRLADIQAVGSQQAYDKAMEQLAADRAASLAAGQQFATLGGQQQQLGLAGLGALETVGGTRQAQQQKALDIAYEDFARETTRPSQQVQEMSSVLRGFNLPVSTYTTQQNQVQQPGLGQQLLGAGLGVYGLGSQFGLFKEGGDVQKYQGQGLVERSIFYPFTEAYKRKTTGKGYEDLRDLIPEPLTKDYAEKYRKRVKGDPEELAKVLDKRREKGDFGPDANPELSIQPSFVEDFVAPLEIEKQEKFYGDPTPTEYTGSMGKLPRKPDPFAQPSSDFTENYDPNVDLTETEKPRIEFKDSGEIASFDIDEFFKNPQAPVIPKTEDVETTKPGEAPTGGVPQRQTPEQYAASAVSPLKDEIKNIREKYDSNVDLMKVEGEGMPKDIIAQIGLALMTRDESVSGDILSQVGSRVGQFMPEIQKRKERREDKAERAAERAQDQEFRLMGLEADIGKTEAEIASREKISRRESDAQTARLNMELKQRTAAQREKFAFEAGEAAKNRQIQMAEIARKGTYDDNYFRLQGQYVDLKRQELIATDDRAMKQLKLNEASIEIDKNYKAAMARAAGAEAKQKIESDRKQALVEMFKAATTNLNPDDPLYQELYKQVQAIASGGGGGPTSQGGDALTKGN